MTCILSLDGPVVRQAVASDVPYKMGAMVEDPERALPADDDVIIWHLQERDGLDVYRVTKGASTVGEFPVGASGRQYFEQRLSTPDLAAQYG